jgi:hypothetical protein
VIPGLLGSLYRSDATGPFPSAKSTDTVARLLNTDAVLFVKALKSNGERPKFLSMTAMLNDIAAMFMNSAAKFMDRPSAFKRLIALLND